MKTLEHYMATNYRMEIVEDRYEGGYVLSFPDLPGCITCADSRDELLPMAEDAKRTWIEASMESGNEIYEPLEDETRLDVKIPRSLKRKLAENARAEGVSADEYIACLVAKDLST